MLEVGIYHKLFSTRGLFNGSSQDFGFRDSAQYVVTLHSFPLPTNEQRRGSA